MSDAGRCPWCGDDPLYVAYHDTEWGVPERDDRALFEKLVLDGFQAGLAWITILRRRDTLRARFEGFEPERVARWGEPEIMAALKDPGIIRSRKKIEGAIKNARAYLAIMETAPRGFSGLLWDYVDGRPIQNAYASMAEAPAKTDLSERMAKDLKKRGFVFCGPVIVYAFMQAVGMVNDHLVGCPRREVCAAMG